MWFTSIHHSWHPIPHFYCHIVLVLGPTLPLSLPGLHGLTQHMDDDWEDTSHADIEHDTLTNMNQAPL